MNVMFSRQLNTAEFQQIFGGVYDTRFHFALVKDISPIRALTAWKRPLARRNGGNEHCLMVAIQCKVDFPKTLA
jgi:hypothetical protein